MISDEEKTIRRIANQAHIVGDSTFIELYDKELICVAEAIIDTEDLTRVTESRWFLNKNGYVFTNDKNNGYLYLAYFILRINAWPGLEIDHKDNDPLNNRKFNLRQCTHAQNSQNKGKKNNNTSGFKGVSWHSASGRWRVQICCNGECMHLGYFNDLIEAANTYDNAAKKYHKEFAVTNF